AVFSRRRPPPPPSCWCILLLLPVAVLCFTGAVRPPPSIFRRRLQSPSSSSSFLLRFSVSLVRCVLLPPSSVAVFSRRVLLLLPADFVFGRIVSLNQAIIKESKQQSEIDCYIFLVPRAMSQVYKAGSLTELLEFKTDSHVDFCRRYVNAAAAPEPPAFDYREKTAASNTKVKIDKMFWSKPCSLALTPESPFRVEEPNYEGIRYFMLKMLLFYSKQSQSIRGANVIYKRVISQVDKPAIYNVFDLEKTFKTTFSLLVLHMWLCLRRLKEEGKEGVEFGQYLYEIYNHDLELRVSKAGVNLLLTKWMKDLEKIFYGNIVAYDAAMLPEARKEDLPNVLWRNVLSDDGSLEQDDSARHAVQALARYVRREASCLALTGNNFWPIS
ncbi:hypothetical protein V2J09_021062, partial [Rumex salicifolius]